MHRVLTGLIALTLPLVAAAGTCDSPYEVDGLLNDLGAAEAALRGMDYAATIQTGQGMRDQLPCLESVLPVVIAPRVYRAIGAGLYLGGEAEDGLKWMRSAAALDPGFAYPDDQLPETHPVRRAWTSAKAEAQLEAMELEGYLLGDGRHFVDGKRVNFPVATPQAFHLYQRDLDGVTGWVIDGNAFPEQATETPEPPEPEPDAVADVEEVVPQQPPSALQQAAVVRNRSWPTERVVLVGGGGAALVGGGILYALSASSRSAFDDANTLGDLDRYRARTNSYAISSGVSLAAGASALGFGMLFFVIDGDPRPTLDLRF